MKLLLDTHTLIWFSADDPSLPIMLRERIRKTPPDQLYVSIVSFWEIAIKVQLGKLKLHLPLKTFIEQIRNKGIRIIPIREEHILQMMVLPLHHRDPFDRMIIAQSITEEFDIAGKDRVFGNYNINLVWNEPQTV